MIKPRFDHPLFDGFMALQKFGRAGDYVWSNAEAIPDIMERTVYVLQSLKWLKKKVAETDRFWELPVDFRTFVECDDLLKKRGILWPKVIEHGARMNDGTYVEVVLTGGIGVAKTTLAVYSIAFQLYVLSCMKHPHRVFDLDPSSEILMVFQSLNKNLAMDVDYRRFRDMIDGSPFFLHRFPYNRDRLNEMRFINNVVVKPVSGQDTAAIGQNVIGGIIDEVNFMAVVEESKMTRDGSVYDQAAENYNSIARRRESRFMVLGDLPGLLCLVSSKNYPGGLTDRKQAEARTNPRIYNYDMRLWDIRPERFGPERFRVFVGDETRQPRILTDEDMAPVDDEPLVIPVPLEYRRQFESNLLKSIRDIAGYSTQSLHPFMLNSEAVAKGFGVVESIISREVVRLQADAPARLSHPDHAPGRAALRPYRPGEVEGQRRRDDRPRAGLQAHEPGRLSGDAADHPVRLDPRSHAASRAGRSSTRRSGRCSTGCATSCRCRSNGSASTSISLPTRCKSCIRTASSSATSRSTPKLRPTTCSSRASMTAASSPRRTRRR